jgi:hypothetical protein
MQVLGELTPIDHVARRRASSRRTELAIALLIFGVGAMVGILAVQTYRAVELLMLLPVRLRTGSHDRVWRGLADPVTRNAPALAAFLLQRSDTFDCATLDPTIPRNH